MPTKPNAPLTVYGLASCDTCRKARKWLDAKHIAHRFHDVRSDGLEEQTVSNWLKSAFAPKLVNRQSTTWRQLSDLEKQQAEETPMKLLLKFPSLVKRPVFVQGDQVLVVGFKPQELEQALKS
jgi:arsenate reductase